MTWKVERNPFQVGELWKGFFLFLVALERGGNPDFMGDF